MPNSTAWPLSMPGPAQHYTAPPGPYPCPRLPQHHTVVLHWTVFGLLFVVLESNLSRLDFSGIRV